MIEQPSPSGPGPVRVGLGRSNVVIALAVTAFLVWIVWAGAHGAWTSDSRSAKILGYGFAALFGVALVMMLRALPRFLSPRYVILDATALRIQHGREQVVLPWAELTGIAVGYELAPKEKHPLPMSPEQLQDRVKTFLADRASEALQVSGARRLALEIYPVRPDAVDRFPRLKPYWQASVPPEERVSGPRWRFPLPPVVSIAQAVREGAHVVRPDRWLGWYERSWNPPTR